MAKAKQEANTHGKNKDIKAQLKALGQEGWDDTEENEGFTELPTDDYPVKIAGAKLNNSKSSGRLQVSFEMQVLRGKYKNRKAFMHIGLDTDENRGKLRAQLAKLGVTWPKIEDLPDTLEELVGSLALLHLNTKPDTREGHEGQMSSWPNFVKAIEEDDLDDDTEEDDEEEKPKKGKSKKAEEPEEDEDEEEDEEEKPKTKKGKAKEPVEEEDDEEGEEDEEEKPAKVKSKKGKTVEEPKIELEFEEDDLDKKQIKATKALAGKLDFDADNYDNNTDLLIDMAEHVGLSGKFTGADKLIAKITTKATEAEDGDDTEEEDEDEDED